MWTLRCGVWARLLRDAESRGCPRAAASLWQRGALRQGLPGGRHPHGLVAQRGRHSDRPLALAVRNGSEAQSKAG